MTIVIDTPTVLSSAFYTLHSTYFDPQHFHNFFEQFFFFNLINIQTFTKQISSKRNVEKFSAKDTKTVFCEILSLKLSTVQSKCTQTSIKVYVDTCLKLSRLTYIRLHLRKFAVLSKELFDYSLFNVIRFY